MYDVKSNVIIDVDCCYGLCWCHLKNIWTDTIFSDTEVSRKMMFSVTSIEFLGLQVAYANVLTEQELDYFMHGYYGVISAFGGENTYHTDNRR